MPGEPILSIAGGSLTCPTLLVTRTVLLTPGYGLSILTFDVSSVVMISSTLSAPESPWMSWDKTHFPYDLEPKFKHYYETNKDMFLYNIQYDLTLGKADCIVP